MACFVAAATDTASADIKNRRRKKTALLLLELLLPLLLLLLLLFQHLFHQATSALLALLIIFIFSHFCFSLNSTFPYLSIYLANLSYLFLPLINLVTVCVCVFQCVSPSPTQPTIYFRFFF